MDKSKKKEKVPQKEQKPYTDYDYPPIHIQYSSEKEVPQGEHNPYADYDYPPVVNKVTPVSVHIKNNKEVGTDYIHTCTYIKSKETSLATYVASYT